MPHLSFTSHFQVSDRHLSYPDSLSNFICLKEGVKVTVFLLISASVQKARKQCNPGLSYFCHCGTTFLSVAIVQIHRFWVSGSRFFLLTLQCPQKPLLLSIFSATHYHHKVELPQPHNPSTLQCLFPYRFMQRLIFLKPHCHCISYYNTFAGISTSVNKIHFLVWYFKSSVNISNLSFESDFLPLF